MQAHDAKAKDIPNIIVKLKKERLLQWHLMNPTNDKVHPSRSMTFISCFMIGFKFVVAFTMNFS